MGDKKCERCGGTGFIYIDNDIPCRYRTKTLCPECQADNIKEQTQLNRQLHELYKVDHRE